MAPMQMGEEHHPDVPDNEVAFYADLEEFHKQRGTSFDRTPRVFTKAIDLWKLFNIVRAKGGYDIVSREKLQWRKLCLDFNLGTHNAPQYAFQLKSVFYKQLAAYEISRVHKQTPPPRHILEDDSAKGGDLLNRTVENYTPRAAKVQYANGADGHESNDGEDDDQKTPKGDKMDVGDPGSTGGRVTRGLRQAPTQRVLFQPDVSSSRQPRQVSNQAQSPQPVIPQPIYNPNSNPASNPNSSSFNILNYEPRQPIALTLRPVQTPASNPAWFKDHIKRKRDGELQKLGKVTPKQPFMLPGTGFDGPNIYVRTLLALRSGIQEEIDYALHHLVKISHERGDKYKFDAFPGLIEELTSQVLKISSLFYKVNWQISYSLGHDTKDNSVLDGLNGTPDIFERISRLQTLSASDDIAETQINHRVAKSTEAALVIRNMSMLEDNAKYLKDQCIVRDLLTIALCLPNKHYLDELKHHVLDICEQLTMYWVLEENDPLYIALLGVLAKGDDRGAALTALRAISRASLDLDLPHLKNTLKNIPLPTIIRILEWTLLDDEELVGACLDFLYQFTAVPENVVFLLRAVESGALTLHPLLQQLARLLQYRASTNDMKKLVAPAIPAKTTIDIQQVPQDLMTEILPIDEPERSSMWLKSLFEENAESDITQIALWQSYQTRFTPHSNPQRPLLPAADFIKNVSTTFPSANAQVINGPQPRFIIKGIRPRLIPTDTKGNRYTPCLWSSPGPCGSFHSTPASMFEHVITQHLGVKRAEGTGQWDVEDLKKEVTTSGQKLLCHWARCHHFQAHEGAVTRWGVAMHLKTHLPDTSDKAQHRAKHNRTKRPRLGYNRFGDEDDVNSYPAEFEHIRWNDTQIDERNDAAGIPFTSVLVLRSLARNVPKAMSTPDAQSLQMNKFRGDDGWMLRLFGPLMDTLFHVAAVNRPLSRYVFDLIRVTEDSIEEEE